MLQNIATLVQVVKYRSVATDENVERVRTLLEDNRKVSARWNGFGLFAPPFNPITCNELKWYLDQTCVRHQFIESDFQKR